MNTTELLNRIRERLAAAHGARLKGVVLYGSEARGEGAPDSDIDVLVLLQGPVVYWDDLRANIQAVYPLVLEIERPIHAKPVDIAAYEAAEFPLYENARTEGIVA